MESASAPRTAPERRVVLMVARVSAGPVMFLALATSALTMAATLLVLVMWITPLLQMYSSHTVM